MYGGIFPGKVNFKLTFNALLFLLSNIISVKLKNNRRSDRRDENWKMRRKKTDFMCVTD